MKSAQCLDFSDMFGAGGGTASEPVQSASPPPSPAVSGDHAPASADAVFQEDLVDSVQFALNGLGFSAVPFGRSDDEGIQEVLSCVRHLLDLRERAMRDSEQSSTLLHRREKDLQRVQQEKSGLAKKLEAKEQSLMREETLRKCKDGEHRKAMQKLNSEKEQLMKRCSRLANLDQGYQAQLRKQEQQYEKLQKQYQRLLKTDSKDRKQASMRTSSNLKRSNSRPTKAKEEKAMDSTTTLVAAYETKQQELLAQNTCLRESMKDFQKDLLKLQAAHQSAVRFMASRGGVGSGLNSSSSASESMSLEGHIGVEKGNTGGQHESENNESEPVVEDEPLPIAAIPDSHFEMPFDWVRDNVEADLSDKISELSHQIQRMRADLKGGEEIDCNLNVTATAGQDEDADEDAAAEGKKSAKVLIDELKKAKEIIQQQDLLIKASLSLEVKPGMSSSMKNASPSQGPSRGGFGGLYGTMSPTMSDLDSETSWLAHEREELEQEKERLSMERQLFDKKAQELDLKGLAMQIAKHDLYEQGAGMVGTPSIERVRSALGDIGPAPTAAASASASASATPTTRSRIISRVAAGTQGSILSCNTPSTKNTALFSSSINNSDNGTLNKENNFQSPTTFELLEPATPATASLLKNLGGEVASTTSGMFNTQSPVLQDAGR